MKYIPKKAEDKVKEISQRVGKIKRWKGGQKI